MNIKLIHVENYSGCDKIMELFNTYKVHSCLTGAGQCLRNANEVNTWIFCISIIIYKSVDIDLSVDLCETSWQGSNYFCKKISTPTESSSWALKCQLNNLTVVNVIWSLIVNSFDMLNLLVSLPLCNTTVIFRNYAFHLSHVLYLSTTLCDKA